MVFWFLGETFIVQLVISRSWLLFVTPSMDERPVSRTPCRRGIRSGVRARARRNAFLLWAAAERQVDPLSAAARPLYTSRFWEPPSSEGEELEEEEEETGGEVTRHDNVIDLTSLQAEELVPRSRLWRPTSKAVHGLGCSRGSIQFVYFAIIFFCFDS